MMSEKFALVLLVACIAFIGIETSPINSDSWKDGFCGENEAYDSMRRGCEERCDDHNPTFCFKFTTVCWCEKGYVRDKSDTCIKVEDCPNVSENLEFSETIIGM
ncbi:Egf0.4 [Bracoviriform demolitoris]|uniref:Probable protease inhibitor Egf0.4b n=2 Tax=Microplitis demolitor bracovirus TaxID=53988 RepID=EG04B_MDBVW|nr:Egf0.4 [Bracoviriform demolitoris]XP_053598853.1 serine protease inhibitor swm-1-like [Microplitis demolitor]Q4ZJY9.1 RecName: Full=Probable protease inhibitor Egf0.4b; Flags: Precursor [Microplitis demolitor bracovirus (isolate Webb)]AAY24529.1 Egf0.4 [Bracoviriform demolitoris]